MSISDRRKSRLKRITNFLKRRTRRDATVDIKKTDSSDDGDGRASGVGVPNPWEIYTGTDTLPGVDDEFMRFKLETANEKTLRQDFKTTVEQAKDPAEKERLRHMVGQQNQMGKGLKSHPILAKFKQFFNREISLLPNQDVEQQVKHQELQNRKEYLKQLQAKNEQEMSLRK